MKNGMITDEYGDRWWYQNGLVHRADGPAVEYADGTRYWYVNGKGHRADGPAVEWADGTREWWLDGVLHRVDGPAMERNNGTWGWWLNGVEYTLTEWLEKNPDFNERTRLAWMIKNADKYT